MDLGRYRLLEEIASGAAGAVHRALDRDAGREVAIKLLHGGRFASPARRARFARETAVLARLRHPGIVTVHAAGEHEGRPYLVMELVRGESLAERLARGGPLDEEAAARLGVGLARALEHAHREGVLHRDVKPSNVLLARDGRVLLGDFGLAKDKDEGSPGEADGPAMTAAGTSMGTPGYWAPELARGDLAKVGPASDVYGVGATLYAALTGVAPQEGQTFLALLDASQRRPPAPSTRRRGLDRELERIVTTCLEVEPGRRPPGAGALAAALEGWLARSGERSRRGVSSRGALAALGVVLGLVGLTALLVRSGTRADNDGPAAVGTVAPDPVAARARLLRVAERARDLAPVSSLLPLLDEAELLAREEPLLLDQVRLDRVELLVRRGWIDQAAERAVELAERPGVTGLRARLVRCGAELDAGRDPSGELEALARLDPTGPDGLCAAAFLAVRRDRFEEAADLARRALRASPGHPLALRPGVIALVGLRRAESARELDRRLELHPDDAWARLIRGCQRRVVADADLGVSLGEPRPNATLLAERGLLRLSLADAAGALADFQRLSGLPGQGPRGLFLAGLALFRLGRAAEARAAWAEAHAKSPALVEGWRGRLAPAEEAELAALTRLPDLAKGMPGLKVGDVPPALRARLEARVLRAPKEARAELGDALLRLARGQRWERVGPHFERARELAPGSAEVALELARANAERDRYADARQALARAAELGAPPLELERIEAWLVRREGRWGRAIDLFQALAARDQEGVEGQGALAAAELLRGQADRALAAAEQAIQRAPDHVPALVLRGEALLRLGRLREALAAGVEAVEVAGGGHVPALELRLGATLSCFREPTFDERTRLISELLDVTHQGQGATPLLLGAGVLALQRTLRGGAGSEPIAADVAEKLLEEARTREPERADLFLAEAALMAADGQPPGTILERVQKARELEPAAPFPPVYLEVLEPLAREEAELARLLTPPRSER